MVRVTATEMTSAKPVRWMTAVRAASPRNDESVSVKSPDQVLPRLS